jgi:hypothetical protein
MADEIIPLVTQPTTPLPPVRPAWLQEIREYWAELVAEQSQRLLPPSPSAGRRVLGQAHPVQ